MALSNRPVSRRRLLSTAALGGSGLLAAYVLGCADGSEAEPTATAASTQPPPSPTVATPPAPSPTARPLRWRRLAPLGSRRPPPRRDHSFVSDHSRLYLFGGRDGETLGDLWMYDFRSNVWFDLTPENGPPARFGHNAMWDWSSGRVIVFGGQGSSGFFNDLWAFDPETNQWTELAQGTSSPAPRYGAGAALGFGLGDPNTEERRLLISHGFTSQGRFDDTWQYELSSQTWTEISPAGPRPIERCLMRAVWDSQSRRLLMFGGQTTGTPFLGDLWELTGDGWREITRELGPSPRNFYAMVFDEDRGYLTLFGGRTEQGPVNDLWLFDSATNVWSQPPFEGEPPSSRFGHDFASLRGGAVLFGGNDGTSDLNDLWVLA